MADINRAASPMTRVKEDVSQDIFTLAKTRQRLEYLQRTKSPFLIGSIDDVNRKISRLDRKLQSYTELVVESRASSRADEFQYLVAPTSAKGRERYQKKVKQSKEVNQFAGVYSMKAAIGHHVSDRVKNISKISMQASKTTLKKDSSGKPKFVELHQYPGYDPTDLTPLPNDVTAIDIMHKVAAAQPNIRKKSQYLPEFQRLFYSQMSQAILQDTFWWFFLEKFQNSRHNQAKLFNRVSHNYVKLLTYAKHPQYRELFLSTYPSLLAQAVYSAFCHSFPDSYRQFGSEFREDLICHTNEWITGVKPAPRSYMNWNYDKLEPTNVKLREDMMDNKKATKDVESILNFDQFDTQSIMNAHNGSSSNLNPYGSRSSLDSRVSSHHQGAPRTRSSKVVACSSSLNAINSVESAQQKKSSHAIISLKVPVLPPGQGQKNPLTPIVEDISSTTLGGMTSHATITHPIIRKKKESHPAGRGPDFIKSAFNINGQSPLVAHFLRMKKLDVDAGCNVRVQRTEMENLPSTTYKDIISDAYIHVRTVEKTYQEFVGRQQKGNAQFTRQQRESYKDHKRREAALLSKHKEVKRLSDLLLLEHKKDPDSVSAGAAAAIEQALMSQE